MPDYIAGIQAAADKNYKPMANLFSSLKTKNRMEAPVLLLVEFAQISSLIYSSLQYEMKLSAIS